MERWVCIWRREYTSVLTAEKTSDFFLFSAVELSEVEDQSMILATEVKVGLNALPELTRQFYPWRSQLLDWGSRTVPLREITWREKKTKICLQNFQHLLIKLQGPIILEINLGEVLVSASERLIFGLLNLHSHNMPISSLSFWQTLSGFSWILQDPVFNFAPCTNNFV